MEEQFPSFQMEVSYALAPPGAPPATKARLVRALEDWDVVAAAEVLEEEGGRGWVEEHGWELVAVVAAHLTPHTEEAGPHLSACCQALLTTLATRVTSAKEVLVALLEQVEELASSLCVTRLLPALSLTLLRLRPRSMSHSWAWALATLTSHLAKAPEPPCRGLEAAERLATDLGEEAREGAHLAAAAVDLVEPLVEFVAKQEGEEGENSRRREVLVRFLVQMLGRPLSVLPQHPEGEVSSNKVFIPPLRCGRPPGAPWRGPPPAWRGSTPTCSPCRWWPSRGSRWRSSAWPLCTTGCWGRARGAARVPRSTPTPNSSTPPPTPSPS